MSFQLSNASPVLMSGQAFALTLCERDLRSADTEQKSGYFRAEVSTI